MPDRARKLLTDCIDHTGDDPHVPDEVVDLVARMLLDAADATPSPE